MPEPQVTDLARLMLTSAEVEHFQRQLAGLREVREREIPELLRDARTFVASDAAEEIAQLRVDLTVVDARVARLEALLAYAEVVDDDGLASEVAALGRAVTVQYVRSGKLATFRLGATGTLPPEFRIVSARSPVGQALIGRTCGDTVAVELPGGHVERMRIVSVDPLPAPDQQREERS